MSRSRVGSGSGSASGSGGGRQFVRYLLPIVLYAGVIFALSTMPLGAGNQLPGLDKLVHFVEYAILGALVSRGLLGYGVSVPRTRVWAVVLSGMYGLSDELHQLMTPFRQGEVLDLLADVLGGLVGSALWLRFASRDAPLGVTGQRRGRGREEG